MQVRYFRKLATNFICLIIIALTLSIQSTNGAETLHQKRVLQETPLHQFNILAEYLDDPSQKQQLFTRTQITKILPIAFAYFHNLIRVTPLDDTKFDAVRCINQQVPNKYKQTGFNSATTDLVIFVRIISLKIQLVSQGASCMLKRRPTYGLLRINQQYFQPNIQKLGQYQKFIYVMIHEIIHILGFNPSNYDYFYEDAYSDKKLSKQEVIQLNPLNRIDYMIVTPRVKAYVQQYFNCYDNITGALLESIPSVNERPGIGAHWNQIPYYNEIMVPSFVDSILRVSRLTLLFLQDMGYYQQVDISLGQDLQYGRNKGCQFARGERNFSLPEFCSINNQALQCSFYGDLVGKCDKNFFSKYVILTEKEQGFCQFPEAANSFNKDIYWENSANSKCLKVQKQNQSKQTKCLNVQCIQQDELSIKVTIQGKQAIGCLQNQQSKQPYIQIDSLGIKVECPKNIRAFCSFKPCQNWCNGKGYCLHGLCLFPDQLLVSPCSVIPNCIKCSLGLQNICDKCVQGFSFIKQTSKCEQCDKKCAKCQNKATNCSKCYIDHIQKVALQGVSPQQSQYTCEICPDRQVAINNICKECELDQFYQQYSKICRKCDSNCATCQSEINCTSCKSYFILNPQNKKCQSCNIFNTSSSICYNCSSLCSSCISNKLNCLTCQQDAVLYKFQSQKNQTCVKSNSFTNGYCVVQNEIFYCQSGCLICLCQAKKQGQQNQNIDQAYKDQTSCLKTLPGYQISQSRVIKCQEGCAVCNPNNANECLQCFQFYTFNQTSKNCIKCSDQCLQCNLNQRCIKCTKGMFLMPTTYRCLFCSQVPHCIACNIFPEQKNAFHCFECQPGYFLEPAQQICTKCMVGCQICNVSILICDGCQVGYFLATQRSSNRRYCKKCGKGCQLCLNQDSCQRCYQGYHRRNIGVNQIKFECFQDCKYPCVQCIINNGTEQCAKCPFGFQLIKIKLQGQNASKNICRQKITQKCASPSQQCSYCPLEYRLAQAKNLSSQQSKKFYCAKCQIQNCLVCLNSSSCSSCRQNFYLDTALNSQKNGIFCRKCAQNCEVCFDKSICYQCKEGFYNSYSLGNTLKTNIQDYRCIACDVSCKTCFLRSSNCEQCSTNYYRLGTECVPSLSSNNYTITIFYEQNLYQFLRMNIHLKVAYVLLSYTLSGQVNKSNEIFDSFYREMIDSHIFININTSTVTPKIKNSIQIKGVILSNRILSSESLSKLENDKKQIENVYQACLRNHRLVDFLNKGTVAGYRILDFQVDPIYGKCYSGQIKPSIVMELAVTTAVLVFVIVILIIAIMAIYSKIQNIEQTNQNRINQRQINNIVQMRQPQEVANNQIIDHPVHMQEFSDGNFNRERNANLRGEQTIQLNSSHPASQNILYSNQL